MCLNTYAQGMISNWRAHYFDMVQWANRSEDSGPVEVEGQGEFPNALWDTMINFEVRYRCANGLEMTCEQTPTSTPAITYFGSDGWIKVDKYPGVMTSSNAALVTHEPEKGEEDFSKILWDKNDFIASIREGRPSLTPIEVGHRDITISQIGLIACQTQEKLTWDPAQEMFKNSNEPTPCLPHPSLVGSGPTYSGEKKRRLENRKMNRRELLWTGFASAACSVGNRQIFTSGTKPVIRLGIASYSFHKIDVTHVIDFMHQLKCPYLNVKDVHLPIEPHSDVPHLAQQYRDHGIQLTDAGAIYFKVDSDEDVRPKFEYLKAAGLKSFVGAPTHAVLPRVERFVKEHDIRMGLHNHGPQDVEWPLPTTFKK